MIGAWKLNEEQVEQIKSFISTTNISDSRLAEMYDVSRVHINHIRHGRRWNIEQRKYIMKEELESKYTIHQLQQESSLDEGKTPSNQVSWFKVVLGFVKGWFNPKKK